jgi:site-specific recombinase
LAAAAASLGPELLSQGAFWWCVAGVALTGVLNVGVSFYLAFLLALKAHNVSGVDRGRIYRAIRQRASCHLLSFLWPQQPSSPPPKDKTHG